jgi:hypothetical protein
MPVKVPGTNRFAVIAMSAAIAFSAAIPLAAQESTPPADTELVTETASQLPAADLPTMNEQCHTFEVSSTFSGTFSDVAVEAPVYSMQAPTLTSEQVKETASNLGIEGEMQDLGNDTYSIEGDVGSLYVTPGRMQFISSEDAPEGDLPDDAQSIASAREWLRVNNWLPANVGEGSVLARVENPGRMIIGFQPVSPAPLISASPNITVTIGPEGAVLESTYGWADLVAGDMYQLRGAESAWAEVESRRAWLDATLPTDQFAPGTTVGGSVEFTRISLAYTTSGIPGEQQYLQPVYVFSGELVPDGTEQRYPVKAYVPALINSNQPVG